MCELLHFFIRRDGVWEELCQKFCCDAVTCFCTGDGTCFYDDLKEEPQGVRETLNAARQGSSGLGAAVTFARSIHTLQSDSTLLLLPLRHNIFICGSLTCYVHMWLFDTGSHWISFNMFHRESLSLWNQQHCRCDDLTFLNVLFGKKGLDGQSDYLSGYSFVLIL